MEVTRSDLHWVYIFLPDKVSIERLFHLPTTCKLILIFVHLWQVSAPNCSQGVQPIPDQHAYLTTNQTKTLTFSVHVIYEDVHAYQCTGLYKVYGHI